MSQMAEPEAANIATRETALACHGDLRPGGTAHHLVNRISGDWTSGTTPGWVFEITWGPATGWPGFSPDTAGQPVPVDVLISADLPERWAQLDRDQAPGYRRIPVEVKLESGVVVEASIFETVTDIDD